jgi:hypothetical protein
VLPASAFSAFFDFDMSAKGQKRRSDAPPTTSGLPPINGHYQTGQVGPFGAINRILCLYLW